MRISTLRYDGITGTSHTREGGGLQGDAMAISKEAYDDITGERGPHLEQRPRLVSVYPSQLLQTHAFLTLALQVFHLGTTV